MSAKWLAVVHGNRSRVLLEAIVKHVQVDSVSSIKSLHFL